MIDVGEHMVKIADVDPVRDDPLTADLDIEVALDCVEATEDRLVADAQGSLMGIDEVAFTEVHPPTDDESPVTLARLQSHAFTDEYEALGDHLRVTEPEPKKSPVAL